MEIGRVVSQDGRHEEVTLSKETDTPRKRSVTATYRRVCTPPGEAQPAKRQRKKNEGNAVRRAICRLDVADHERYKEAERVRKRKLASASIAWAAPKIWQRAQEESSGCSDTTPVLTRVHEHVQLTPRGSRMHRVEHTSPGGTTRSDERTSPADARETTRKQRCEWRSRIAHARNEARMETRVRCYKTECSHCGEWRLIRPDGCMDRHSNPPVLNSEQRIAYVRGDNEFECPGSCVYYGPCEESEEEDE